MVPFQYDSFGCDGWEISAHANSAPDHEPIQGRQYSDAAYTALNNSLVRRIGTLNCGHAAFPIIMGVSEPQYTSEELEKFRKDNADGVTVDGKHYTGYEATQMQRKLERAIRKRKTNIVLAKGTDDSDKLLNDQIRLQRLQYEYKRFSKAAGLRTENERAEVTDFGYKQATKARGAAEANHKKWLKSIGAQDSELSTLAKYYDGKYNNSQEYQLLRKYARSVETGLLSPLAGFGLYKEYYNRIQSEVVGITVGNTKIVGQTRHFLERVFGCMQDPKTGKPRSGTALNDVFDCLKCSVAIEPIKTDVNGSRSFTVVGHRAKVSIDPDIRVLIQTNPWRC